MKLRIALTCFCAFILLVFGEKKLYKYDATLQPVKAKALTNKNKKTSLNTLKKEIAKPDLQVISSDDNGVKLFLQINGFQIDEVVVKNMVFHKLSFPESQKSAYAGNPELPCLTTWVIVPYGVEVGYTLEQNQVAYETGFTCYPSQDFRAIFDNTEKPPFVMDEKVYNTNTFFPMNRVLISKPFIFRGVRMVKVSMFPIQFNPAKKQLAIQEKMDIHLTYEGKIDYDQTKKAYENLNEYYGWPIIDKCCNNGDILSELAPYPIYARVEAKTRYLIITHDDFYDEVVPLAEWKTRKGLKAEIVRTLSLSTSPDTGHIAQCIRDKYTESIGFLSYVLLVGDAPDFIPTAIGSNHPEVLHCRPYGYIHEDDPATDMYYTTLFGNDMVPDLYIGRLPVKTAPEAAVVIDKILDYEMSPDTSRNWPGDVLLATVKEEGRTFFDFTMWLRDFLIANAKTPYLVIDSIPPDPGITDIVIDRINAGVGIIHHYDHGNSNNGRNCDWDGYSTDAFDGWKHPPFHVEDIPSLTNATQLPVMININCRTGWFDGDECDCQGEAMLKSAGSGAVGFIGASRVSYEGYTDEFSRSIWRGMYPDYDSVPGFGPTYCLGELLLLGKIGMQNNFIYTEGAGYSDLYIPKKDTVSLEEFNLLGDPEMPLLTQRAYPMTVKYTQTIPRTRTKIYVTVFQETWIGGIYERWPIQKARVCLHREGKLHAVNYTDINGKVKFSGLTLSAGEILVTVTRHNYYPHLGEITVTP